MLLILLLMGALTPPLKSSSIRMHVKNGSRYKTLLIGWGCSRISASGVRTETTGTLCHPIGSFATWLLPSSLSNMPMVFALRNVPSEVGLILT